ncbi:hypothetical protein [Ralstonia phage phiRSL1]|uniref:Uncharacterized protein n=1 Tax=Ralstonia phage phiRSL1 TaxID=1980924 RepID=B2ZXP3_9CAUD|nr:hypothetical protein RSL1_ORF023 [Ralstonia phage phiRSL1]BAG41468.1 hypothetical protein [Ralstonia phage phiRSL1]
MKRILCLFTGHRWGGWRNITHKTLVPGLHSTVVLRSRCCERCGRLQTDLVSYKDHGKS